MNTFFDKKGCMTNLDVEMRLTILRSWQIAKKNGSNGESDFLANTFPPEEDILHSLIFSTICINEINQITTPTWKKLCRIFS